MKWLKLGGKKEPAFNQRLLICNEKTKFWGEGLLSEIKTIPSGKEYFFESFAEAKGDDRRPEIVKIKISDCTHFCEIELPNQEA